VEVRWTGVNGYLPSHLEDAVAGVVRAREDEGPEVALSLADHRVPVDDDGVGIERTE